MSATTQTTTAATVQVGKRFPDFTLKLATKDGPVDFTLSQHLGNGPIVLAFFPLAFTGTCTKEMCDFRDHLGSFASLKAQVYGFSADTAPSNKAFIEKEGLTFGILCDPNHQVIGKAWPANLTPILGVNTTAQRGVCILDAEGTVTWFSASPDPKVWIGTDEVRKHLA